MAATSHDIVIQTTCCMVHTNECNNCQHCWRKLVILPLITALSVPSFKFPLSVFTRPRGKIFPRGQLAVPPRGLTIFWCIFSRFSTFCINVWCFLKSSSRKSQLDTPCLQQSRKKKTRQTFSRGQHCCDPMQTGFASHRKEMLGLVAPKVWLVSNCTQQVQTLLWFHACKRTQRVRPNNVASTKIDLLGMLGPTMLRPLKLTCSQQLWLHSSV